ncbi:MAG: chromosomal replication initiator DnaA [Ahrensia sp.]|nr:chromosomal replication initiator DnaA [Ahrensia sp.]
MSGRDERVRTSHSTGTTAGAIALCDAIIDLTAIFFNVSSKDLRSSGRTPNPVSRVRQIGMYVGHVTLGLKMTEVGAGFGRDKSTVVHACHTIEDMRDDEDFDLIVARVERLVSVAFALDRQDARRDG